MEILIALVAVGAFVWFNTWHERHTSKHLHDFFRRDDVSDRPRTRRQQQPGPDSDQP